MKYKEFIKTKQKEHNSCGFDIDESALNNNLFDFQKHIVKIALK